MAHFLTLVDALNLCQSLVSTERYAEAKAVVLEARPHARRLLGDGNEVTIKLRYVYCQVCCLDFSTRPEEMRLVKAELEDVVRTCRRTLGPAHPNTISYQGLLERVVDRPELPADFIERMQRLGERP